MELTPVQGQLADVQVLSGDHQNAGGGGHDDAVFVEPLHVFHPGDSEPFPAHQLQAVAGGGYASKIVHFIVPPLSP